MVGTVPTYEEARRFLESKEANKRAQLIDQFLKDPRFAEQQRNIWDEVLFSRNPALLVRDREPRSGPSSQCSS
ncbi:MAG: DUF1549 domain-containing protein [Gemmataceae bacterium]